MTSWRRPDIDWLKASGRWPLTIFVDDGGVLNDNRLRGPEWRRLIGEFMPKRLGGSGERWSEANETVFPKLWRDLQKRLPDFANHESFQRAYATSWVSAMCDELAVTPPPDAEAIALFRDLSIYVAERADSAIPGAADAIMALSGAGHKLYTASGTTSWELRGIVTKMGIAGAFSQLCGPDLVDRVKYGPAFYEKLFAHSGVVPEHAIVIDSDAQCCEWASGAGAHALWIDDSGRGDAKTLAELVSRFF